MTTETDGELGTTDRESSRTFPSFPGSPHRGVQNLRLGIGGAVFWRVELATGTGEAIPTPLPYDGFFELCSPPDPAAEEYWSRTTGILLELSATEPRQVECWCGPRQAAGPSECQGVLEYRFSRGPVDRIEICAREGILYGEVITLLRTDREAEIPPVPFVIVGSYE